MEFFPFRRPYYYYTGDRYRNMQYSSNPNLINQRKSSNEQLLENTQTESSQAYRNGEQTKRNQSFNQEEKRTLKHDEIEQKENPIFEIFGIKLFFDDILIIALIFFLYNEGVRDNLLFIALILLLLS